MNRLHWCLVGLLLACQSPTDTEQANRNPLADGIQFAHATPSFLEQEVLQGRLSFTWRGTFRFSGTLYSRTNSSQMRFDRDSVGSIIFDGQNYWLNPDTAHFPGAKSSLLTWQYFFLAPYKMRDPGTVWQYYGQRQLNEHTYESGRLSFAPQTGVSPDDWYMVYADPETYLLQAMAYIVTEGQTLQEAEADPHAITYHDYQTIQGIPIAHHWKFWNWSIEEGLQDQIGEASLTDLQFVPAKGLFSKPAHAVAVSE